MILILQFGLVIEINAMHFIGTFESAFSTTFFCILKDAVAACWVADLSAFIFLLYLCWTILKKTYPFINKRLFYFFDSIIKNNEWSIINLNIAVRFYDDPNKILEIYYIVCINYLFWILYHLQEVLSSSFIRKHYKHINIVLVEWVLRGPTKILDD